VRSAAGSGTFDEPRRGARHPHHPPDGSCLIAAKAKAPVNNDRAEQICKNAAPADAATGDKADDTVPGPMKP